MMANHSIMENGSVTDMGGITEICGKMVTVFHMLFIRSGIVQGGKYIHEPS